MDDEDVQRLFDLLGRGGNPFGSGGVEPDLPDIKDPGLCDNPGCSNPTTSQCSKCKVRIFCGRECQVAAWKSFHKAECPSLQLAKRTSQICETIALAKEDATSMGVIVTQSHGTHFYVMEKFETHGDESNRKVVLASTEDLSLKGITDCIMDSINFPEFDCDAAGRRRPYYVEIFKETFPDPTVVDSICVLMLRLGITIKSLTNEAEGHEWNTSWFLVHNRWNEEITDPIFLALIKENRRKPLPANGMARQAIAESIPDQKSVPRLNPDDFPKRAKVLKLPYSKNKTDAISVVCKDGVVRVLWHRGRERKVLVRQQVQLQKRTGRPYPDDVALLIYKAVTMAKMRPQKLHIAQPSVCVLPDIESYEKLLDNSVCKNWINLAAKNNLEDSWEAMARSGVS